MDDRRDAREMALGGLVIVAGMIAFVGALYGLFGPLVDEGGRTTSYFEHEGGPSSQVWTLFTIYIAGAVAVVVAGAMLVAGVLRPAATFLLAFSSLGLGALAGFTVFGVGWLVLPGASLAVVAMLVYVFGDTAE